MLARQLQSERPSIPARTAHDALPQERLDGCLLNRPSCPPEDPLGQRTELNLISAGWRTRHLIPRMKNKTWAKKDRESVQPITGVSMSGNSWRRKTSPRPKSASIPLMIWRLTWRGSKKILSQASEMAFLAGNDAKYSTAAIKYPKYSYGKQKTSPPHTHTYPHTLSLSLFIAHTHTH